MRTAFITGGTRGIGLACARRLAADGFRLVITGRDEAALARVATEFRDARVLSLDVTDAEAWGLVEVEADVLLTCAGVASAAPVHRATADDFREAFEVNVIGTLLAVQAVLPGMRARNWGRLIAMGSSTGLQGFKYASAYSASKHAVLGLMRTVALEVAGTGVTANTVCPSIVDGEMTDRSIGRIVEHGGLDRAAARAQLESYLPLGRLLTENEVASAVAFFAREDSATINGQSILLDGGGLHQ
jgi:NAD(P)-dependent dehydrogenase (short-subunit alcohol dehydrogenase family)